MIRSNLWARFSEADRSEELSGQTFPIPSDHESLPPLLYQWQEGVEDLENYFPVATHPTHIGDRYQNNRYEVVHKLGFGSYSTVWLAKNHDKSCFVALKIVVATFFEESREAKILTRLASGKQNHPGRRSVLTLLDEFTITRPNGRHQCIVTEALGCSIANSKNETMPWKFPVNAARAIGVQVLLGLDYIHSCGVVHGDGKSTGPETHRYCIPPARTYVSCQDVKEDCGAIIADFGEAFLPTESPTRLHTPVLLLPPEFLFDESLGTAIDLWTLGSTLLGLMGRQGELGADEMAALEKLLSSMLTYEPALCITAKEALASEWMYKWGLPAWKKTTLNVAA
ncbi:hypothetical protein RJ035_006784 [Blastomyces gilchristii]